MSNKKKQEQGAASTEQTKNDTNEVKNDTNESVAVEQKETEQGAASTEDIADVEVPSDAETISNEEAFKAAVAELERLKVEKDDLEKIVQDLEKDKMQLLKEKEEIQAQLSEALKGNNNLEYIALLTQFEAKLDEYAGLRRERLRAEFITDLKEEIARQKEHFNA